MLRLTNILSELHTNRRMADYIRFNVENFRITYLQITPFRMTPTTRMIHMKRRYSLQVGRLV
jgi:hypothetical protein